MLSVGSTGSDVKELQLRLAALGYDVGPIDGIFGPKTRAAVIAFQTDSNIDVDGIVGPQTFGALDLAEASETTDPVVELPTGEELTEVEPDSTVDAGGGVTVSEQDLPEEEQAGEGVGTGGVDPETQLTILTGSDMQWFFDSSSGNWYVSYGLPNSDMSLVFEAAPDQMDALFGPNMRPESFTRASFNDIINQTSGATFAGNVAEMEGTGSFEDEVQKVISLALDNGALPSWMAGSEAAFDVIFVAQVENKSNQWVMDQFAKLPEFQQRFPNIQQLQDFANLTLEEAVTGFLQFEAGLRQAVASTGGDSASITPDIVGGMLTNGFSLTDAVQIVKSYDKIEQSQAAFSAFNSILVANGIEPMTTTQDFYDFISGNAPSEIYDIYEASSIQQAAESAGLGDVFTAQDAINAAFEGEFNAGTANQSFQQAAQLLLRLRHEVAVGEFGLDTDELLDLSLGLTPSSGRSQAEILEAINRATLAAQGTLQQRARAFKGFSPEGRIQSASLSALRQSS